jgi:hypothetical protein
VEPTFLQTEWQQQWKAQLAQHDFENNIYGLRIASSKVLRLRMVGGSTERPQMAANLQNDTWNTASPGLTVGSLHLDCFSHSNCDTGKAGSREHLRPCGYSERS